MARFVGYGTLDRWGRPLHRFEQFLTNESFKAWIHFKPILANEHKTTKGRKEETTVGVIIATQFTDPEGQRGGKRTVEEITKCEKGGKVHDEVCLVVDKTGMSRNNSSLGDWAPSA